MRRLMPLAAALIAAAALTGCDEKSGAAAPGGPRDAEGKAEAPAMSPPGRPLVVERPSSDYVGTAEELDLHGRRLFDGQGPRSGPVALGGGGLGVGRGYAFSFGEAAEGGMNPRTKVPPLPDAGEYRYSAAASDGSAKDGGETLLGFAAFQIERRFPSAAPIMSRLGWKAARRRGAGEEHAPQRVTVHHTQGPQTMGEAETARAVRGAQRHHMAGRGKEGKENFDDIGYHFLIAGDGRVVEGRRAEYVGAHAGGANEGNIGVAMMGDFNKVKPTGAQVESLTRLVTYLSIKYKKDPLAKGFLEPHRHYTNTDCPGRHLMSILESLRRTIDREHDQIAAGRPSGAFAPMAVLAASVPGA